MRYDLATIVKRTQNPRRKTIDIRPIAPPAMLAQALFARCYRPIVNAWANALPRIMSAYERSQRVNDSAETLTHPSDVSAKSALLNDSISDLSAFLDSIGKELADLVLQLLPELREWAARVEQWHAGQWRGAVLSATNVDIETMLLASGTPQSVRDTIAWNTDLIADVSAQARQRIASIVFAGLRDNRPARDVARELREAVGMSRQRSLRIASDQLVKLTSALDRERRADAGIRTWRWRWSHKRHGRKEHIARDGKVYADTPELAGEGVLPPPEDLPGTLPYCGCRAQAVLSLS